MRSGRKAYVVSYWLSSMGWIQLNTIYSNKKSALQRRRRILKRGIPNISSRDGRVYPGEVSVGERILFSR